MDSSCRLRWDSKLFFRITVITVLILNCAWLSSAKMLIEADKALRKIYPDATQFDAQPIHLSDEQVKLIEEKAGIIFGESHLTQVQYYTIKNNDHIVGYAFEDVVIGKWGPIHYLAGLDHSGSVKQVIILEYKEIRGKPIAKKRFLRQYQKKTVNDPVKLRRDIDGITGATISSRSLTNGIRKILVIFNNIINR